MTAHTTAQNSPMQMERNTTIGSRNKVGIGGDIFKYFSFFLPYF
jgi:hypothetical protein